MRRRRRRQKYRSLLVLLLAGLALVWLESQLQSDSATETSEPKPSPENYAHNYAYHQPSHEMAVLQRLWLAVVLGETHSLNLDSSTLKLTEDVNDDLVLALWAHLQGTEATPSRATRASLDFLLERPNLLAESLRFLLRGYEATAKEHLQEGEGEATAVCPFDASARLGKLPDGTAYCPQESDPSHQKPLASGGGLHMLLDLMHAPRPGDMEWIDQALGITPGQAVIDLGAGVGAYTFPLSERVGESGMVWAPELDPVLVEFLDHMAQELELSNVKAVESLAEDLRLPSSVADTVLIIDISVCTDNPEQFFSQALTGSIHNTLKPNGRMLVLRKAEEEPEFERYAQLLEPLGFALETHEYKAKQIRELMVFRRK